MVDMMAIPMVTSLHEGLIQQTTMTYNLDEDMKRCPGTTFCRRISFHLPLFLTVEFWKRHEYSLQDIRTTLQFFASVHLWQCALLYGGISPLNSAIKLAFSKPESMIYGSKAIVIKNIIKKLHDEQQYSFSDKDPSVLDTLRQDHIPPLPLHKLSAVDWESLVNLTPTEPVDLLSGLTYPYAFAWKDIHLVPLAFEKGAIRAMKIIRSEVFYASGRVKRESMSNQPVAVRIAGQEYCGVDELCLFLC